MKHGNATAYQVFDNNLGAYISISGVNSDNYKDAKKIPVNQIKSIPIIWYYFVKTVSGKV